MWVQLPNAATLASRVENPPVAIVVGAALFLRYMSVNRDPEINPGERCGVSPPVYCPVGCFHRT